MKIERLNENSIRCTLNRADLDSRELRLSELAYGTEKAKSLFRDMIAQASFECGFEAEDIPLMIEAIPVSPDCIILVITKVEAPEELDTRFSKFAPSDEDDIQDYEDMLDNDYDDPKNYIDPSTLINKINAALNEAEDFIPFSDLLSGRRTADTNKVPETSTDANIHHNGDASSEDNGLVILEKLFSFDSLNQAASACSAIQASYNGESMLYKNPVNMRYYLLLQTTELLPDIFAGICNTLTEYGKREKFSYASCAYLDEHYEIIIKKNAVSVLADL